MARSRSDSAARRRALAAAALLTGVLAGPAGTVSASPQAGDEEAYPSDITPPVGTQYPCALTPLPRALPGIPEGDRTYLNRAYTRILRATQAKLVLLKALEEGSNVKAALARYQDATRRLAERLAAEPAPSGLAPFQEDVLQALALQQAFFARAVPLRVGPVLARERRNQPLPFMEGAGDPAATPPRAPR